jgi:hypothetical protein
MITLKTFFFLRMFSSLTPIVVMLQNVIYDLRIFLFFYTIMLFFFSLLFAVLGMGNFKLNKELNGIEGRLLKGGGKGGGGGGGAASANQDGDIPAEFQSIGLLVGEFMWTFQISMGNFSLIPSISNLSLLESQIFWLLWFITTLMTCIVFLNFVVAEAMGSYERVIESLQPVIMRERAVLISESEEMTLKRYQTPEKYPKYLIVREIE